MNLRSEIWVQVSLIGSPGFHSQPPGAILHTAARVTISKPKLGDIVLLLKPSGDFQLHLHCVYLISVLVNV